MSNTNEERLLTLFADVHYYFAEPVARPLHHRFDKASYVYLYRDATNKRGRLEIANHAGTPEQDAFTGYLDTSKIRRSHKHPTLCTIVVDGYQDGNPRDEGNFLFRLHTIDLYFWTNEDAETFVDNVQKTLKQEQLEILDAPPAPAPHPSLMSPVVRQLESVAITDPAYHNGHTRNSRTASIPTHPDPPVVEEPAKAHTPLASKEENKSYAPLAYNPAAPAAPEPIKHREKTPPPPEAIVGTGLAAAAYQDQLHGHAQQPPASLPPPPPPPPAGGHPQSSQPVGGQSHYPSSGYTSPSSSGFDPQSPFSQGHRASSMSSPQAPPVQSPPINPYFPHHAASVGSASRPGSAAQSQMQLMRPSSISHNHDSGAHLYGQGPAPLESPTVQILGSSYVAPPPQPLQHLQPQYADYLASHTPPQQPIGGYSDYKYDEPHRHHGHHSHNQDQEIHSQVYRPTEEESRHHRHRNSGASGSSSGHQPGKLEQKAEKYEKGVNRFLRKLEKRIG